MCLGFDDWQMLGKEDVVDFVTLLCIGSLVDMTTIYLRLTSSVYFRTQAASAETRQCPGLFRKCVWI